MRHEAQIHTANCINLDKLTAFLIVIGIVAGSLTGFLSGRFKSCRQGKCNGFELHTIESCRCYPSGQIIAQWKQLSPFRTILALVLTLFAIVVATGQIGPQEWNWIRISILVVSGFSLFIVVTVPDHFLHEHLRDHVAIKHVPRIFLWTFGTLLVAHVMTEQLHLEELIGENQWIMLVIAAVVGAIPESGPHLIFVTLFAQGAIPLCFQMNKKHRSDEDIPGKICTFRPHYQQGPGKL
jgi:hypothetical protein